MIEELINFLSKFVTDNRNELFRNIIKERTRYITVVLEDIYQSQNASAVLRTCECFGIQDVHIVENQHQFKVHQGIVLGATNWINLYKYNRHKHENTEAAIKYLKSKSYRIIATTPHQDDVDLEAFDLDKGKVAICFGSELDGISTDLFQYADEFMKIPMYGFTESLNISVSAAIVIHHLMYKLKQSSIKYGLSKDEQNRVLLSWLRNSIKKSDHIINHFLKKNNYNSEEIQFLYNEPYEFELEEFGNEIK